MAQCPFNNNLHGEGYQCPESSEGINGCFLWGTGCPNKAGGNVYSKTMTMTDDNTARFETEMKTLRDIQIKVEIESMLLGSIGAEVYHVEDDGVIGFSRIDISTLYFKNKRVGRNATITILGVLD